MNGYQPGFIHVSHRVSIPDYNFYASNTAINVETDDDLIPYIYYSVVKHKHRRLPIFTASNIYRSAFTSAPHNGSFKKDRWIAGTEQLGSSDYSIFNTIKKIAIEKGHMVKKEDVQWDEINDEAKSAAAAKSTFYYPNAVPQHDALNNGLWKLLENCIIIKGRVPMPPKVCAFTGPVLDPRDPLIVSGLAEGTKFLIPILFWKVVYYVKPDNQLYCAAFLMGQFNQLKRDKIITVTPTRDFQLEKGATSLKPFLEFEDDEKYQVPIALTTELTHFQFTLAIDLHQNQRPLKLVLKEVQPRSFEQTVLRYDIKLIENINV